MSSLRIAEIFTSIQGEGIWVGMPSTFIRVSGCNLRCVWCDTKYASWHPEGPVMSIEDVVDQVQAAHVVVTGGEPMLFEATEELCRQLRTRGSVITIETAGTVFREVECDLMSISPKLSNSTPGLEAGGDWPERHERTRRDLEPLRQLTVAYDYQLKFVVNPEEGLDLQMREIEETLGHLDGVRSDRVLLMAEGTDTETLHRRERLLVPVALARRFRITPRLHIDLFGNTKGT